MQLIDKLMAAYLPPWQTLGCVTSSPEEFKAATKEYKAYQEEIRAAKEEILADYEIIQAANAHRKNP